MSLSRHCKYDAKLSGQPRRTIIREVSKCSATTQNGLQISLAEIGETVQASTISSALHRYGLHNEVNSKKDVSCSKIWEPLKEEFVVWLN